MSLEPARHNWKIWRGATFHKKVTILEGGIGSDPRDLTGYTALLEIKDVPDGTVLLTLSTANSGIVLGGALGTVEIIISDTATATLTWKSGIYDLMITDAGGSDETDAILFGNFTVTGV